MTPAEPQVVRAVTGEIFDVRLEATPTSGYVWEIDPATLFGLVELISSEILPSPAGVVGGTASQSFRFRAIRSGEARLLFRYRRRWENTPIRETAVQVIVEDPSQARLGDG
jgi:predicted secreted protein